MTPGPECLEEAGILGFLEGKVSPQARAAAEAHLAECAACTDLMTWAASELVSRGRVEKGNGQPFVGRLAPGSQVGRYQILGAVGRGGMGEVYAAYHPDLDRRIALKVLYESGAGLSERRTRLLREARAIARLSHPNVVGVYDAGTVGDRVYIAMELVDGQTLDEWLRTEKRRWREILDVFLAAGHGLAAAHAADVVHRDFKPQNVMIGKDGIVRFMDFGLARLVEDLPAASESRPAQAWGTTAPAGRTASVTRTGALIGTPAYMAPEQFRGEAADARADQFSFCVALYEALFGARPDAAHSPKAGGQGSDASPREYSRPFRRSSAPPWLRSALRRGLSVDPDERFTTMEALLSALARGRASARRRSSAVAALLGVALVIAGVIRFGGREHRIVCTLPSARIASAWSGEQDDARRAAMRGAFLASGLQQAESSWHRVSSTLDRYIREWREMYMDACEATHVRGEQSGDVLDLRMGCLSTSLDEVRALTAGLLSADASVVARAAGAMTSLTPVARCADLAVLRSAVPLPRDPATLASVQELRQVLRDAEALQELGKASAALRLVQPLEPRIGATKYKPIRAEWSYVVGSLNSSLFRPSDAERFLEEAFETSIATGDHLLAAKAASYLTYAVGCLLRRFEEGERWARLGNASLDALPTGPVYDRIRGWLAHDLASVRREQRLYADAVVLFQRSIQLKEKSLGPDHPDVGITLDSLSMAWTEMGLYDRALGLSDRVRRITLQHGPYLPHASRWLNNRGELLAAIRRYADAQAAFESSIPLLEDEMGRESRAVAYPLTGFGEVLLAQGHPRHAVVPLERALAIRIRSEANPALVGQTHFALARALWAAGLSHARARVLARAAARLFSTAGSIKEAEKARAWLRIHGAPPRSEPAGTNAGTSRTRDAPASTAFLRRNAPQ